MAQPAAIRSADLINSFGVDTHIGYTDGQYLDIAADLTALQYLGLNHVRDGAPNPNSDVVGQVHLGVAADAGIKFTFVADDPDPLLVVQRIHAFVAAHPGSVVGIEGPNEVNNWPVSYAGLTGTAGAQAYQQALYNAVNADPLLKDIPVLGFTDWPEHASASDWNNIHPYPKNGDQPYDTIAGNAFAQAAVDPGKPFAITEMGYHTSLTADTAGGWEGVSEATQAKLLLNALMDAAALGSQSTSIYELLDAYADPLGSNQEDHFGLFRLDGSAKPAADAVHNLTSILADAGGNAANFGSNALNYSTTGLPSSGHTYLTQKSDGSFQIIAWNEPDIWNETTDTPITAASTPVTVSLGQIFSTVQVFDPLQGAAAVQTLHNVSSVSLGLTDHPLIIQTSTDGSAAQPQPTSGIASLITDATDAAVARLYYGLLNRAPDASGLQHWEAAAHNGGSISAVAQSFLNSGEYAGQHAGETDQQFVDHLYTAALGRAADPSGEQSWLHALSHGSSRADVAVGIIESPEAQQHLAAQVGSVAQPQLTSGIASLVTDATDAAVARLYYGLLNRAPDASGLQHWEAAAHNGGSISAVAQSFLNSGEYAGQHAGETDQQFVDHLYTAALGRAADPSGEQSWLHALSHGSSRADVAVGIIESPEAQQHLAAQVGQGWHIA
ncbi:DUF4214 domain-containing protein [Methylobacterium sp. P31]